MTITGSGFSLKDIRGPTRKAITYAAGTTGLQGAVTDVFPVTGEVLIVYMLPYCTTSLDESAGTPTLQLGVTSASNILISATNAVDIDANDFWTDTTPSPYGVLLDAKLKDVVTTNNIVTEVAGTNNISAGVIEYTCYWMPISTDGNLVAAA